MKRALLERLRCPACHSALSLVISEQTDTEIERGELICDKCGAKYIIERAIPRFVPANNYAINFGIQWNLFRQTQLDSFSGHTISRDRFYGYTGWISDELKGKWILDVGCGAGRFTEIALAAGAHVVALDYSSAVEACWANHKNKPLANVVQGNIYQLPFAPESFDYVYCLGVLQHTPDVRKSFHSLPEMLCPGGKLAVDLYPLGWQNLFMAKHWLRPLTTRMDTNRLFERVKVWAPRLLPISRFLSKIPIVGRKMRWAIPVANYEGVYPLNDKQLEEWAILDTFDWLAPTHDHPQTLSTLNKWFAETSLEEVEVFRRGHLVGRGVKRSRLK